jgi:hypothetical protein
VAGGEKGQKSEIRPDAQFGRDPGNKRVQRGDHRPLTTGIFTAESAEDAEKIQIQMAKSKIKIRRFGGALKLAPEKGTLIFFAF